MENKYNFKNWCIDHKHQDWLNSWDYELNHCSPEDVPYKSKERYYFKCPRGIHTSQQKTLCSVIQSKRGPIYCKQCHSFGQWMIDNLGDDSLGTYWSDKNIISPFDIASKTSGHKVWIKCVNPLHPDYQICPYKFVVGHRCSVCANLKIIPGINSIQDTHPELVQYFENPQDALKYSIRAGARVSFKCPICGYIKQGYIDDIFSRPFSCPQCGDGISYPEKFVHCMLNQIKNTRCFSVQRQKRLLLKNQETLKQYDFYLDMTEPIIIETHGIQHFEETHFCNSKKGRSLVEEQKNDELKMNIAIQCGISRDRYIILDCRESDKQYIKNSIMHSRLPLILDFVEKDINWDLCDKSAVSSWVKQACDIWNSGSYTLKAIGTMMGCSASTIGNYLKQGAQAGLCEYGVRI